MPKSEIIRVAVALMVKPQEDGSLRFLTQRRVVQNKDYDPLYDNTHELMGESVEEGESILDALRRGVEEEYGATVDDAMILGAGFKAPGNRRDSTRSEDEYHSLSPLLITETIRGCQPWLGYCFVVVVGPEWEPNPADSDGEAVDPRWWTRAELAEELCRNPVGFMGFHVPLLRMVLENLEDWK